MIQQSPTYMAYNAQLGGWAFSPSYIEGADVVYDISHWSWEHMSTFMTSIPESSKIDFLEMNGVLMAKKPENIG